MLHLFKNIFTITEWLVKHPKFKKMGREREIKKEEEEELSGNFQ